MIRERHISLYLPHKGADDQPACQEHIIKITGNATVQGYEWARYLCAAAHNLRIHHQLPAIRLRSTPPETCEKCSIPILGRAKCPECGQPQDDA